MSLQLLEAESWLAEQSCVLDIEDKGQSAKAAQASLRRLEATRRDLEGFGRRLERLQQTAALLESRQNPERWVGARPIQGRAGRGTRAEAHKPGSPVRKGSSRLVLRATAPRCWPG